MADSILPTVIQGPARVAVGGVVLHVQNDITVNQQVDSWNPASAFGPIGERHRSRKDVLSLTPVGMINAGLLDFFYGAYSAPTTTLVGASIAASAAPVISSITENKTYTWQRGGLTRPPSLALKPTSTAFGALELTCWGKAATQPLDTAFWHGAEGVVGADATFEESSIISDLYKAALGVRATPYDAMGGMDGFDIEFNYETREIPASDLGIADIILSGIGLVVRFAPSNLTEAQVNVLLAIQNTGAILPGQAYAKAGENLVITGINSGWVFTVATVGAKRSERVYAVGEHRFRQLEFVNQRTWTAGVAQALLTCTAPA